MSYILDALKKVEREKLKKTGPTGMTSISGDLFQEPIQPPASGGRWKIVILIGIVSLMTFAGTWFMLKGNKPKNAPVAPPAVSSVAPPAVTPPSVPLAAPVPVPAPVQPVAAPAVNVVSPAPSSTEKPVDEGRPARTVKRALKQAAPAVAPLQLKPSPQTIQPPADIKLSGIAWQEERSARRAVVNGFLLKEGAVVSGARITEIKADKVRFALPGGTFELRLDAAPVAPAAEVRR